MQCWRLVPRLAHASQALRGFHTFTALVDMEIAICFQVTTESRSTSIPRADMARLWPISIQYHSRPYRHLAYRGSLTFTGRVDVLYGRVETQLLAKSCVFWDKCGNLYYKTVEKVCFRWMGGLGGLGGFMVQGLSAPGFAHCQSSIQVLFFKFSVPSTPTVTLMGLTRWWWWYHPGDWTHSTGMESQLEKTPLYWRTDHQFFYSLIPPGIETLPNPPTLPLSIMIYIPLKDQYSWNIKI